MCSTNVPKIRSSTGANTTAGSILSEAVRLMWMASQGRRPVMWRRYTPAGDTGSDVSQPDIIICRDILRGTSGNQALTSCLMKETYASAKTAAVIASNTTS